MIGRKHMHIPPYYKKRTWQSFFLGVFGWCHCRLYLFFICLRKTYRTLVEKTWKFRTELKQVKQENDLLKQDKENLNEEHEEKLTIQSFGNQFR